MLKLCLLGDPDDKLREISFDLICRNFDSLSSQNTRFEDWYGLRETGHHSWADVERYVSDTDSRLLYNYNSTCTILFDQIRTWNFPDKRLRYRRIARDAEYVDLKIKPLGVVRFWFLCSSFSFHSITLSLSTVSLVYCDDGGKFKANRIYSSRQHLFCSVPFILTSSSRVRYYKAFLSKI
jgi:hypothetical protein